MDISARIFRRLLVVPAAVVAVLLAGAPAWAHNSLVEAQPGKGATLSRSPAEVRLRFLQKLDPGRTSITVSDAAGRPVSAGGARTAGKVGTVALVGPLPNGAYTVAYQVASTDGHPVKGSYLFTVAVPGAAPVASPPVSALPVSAPPVSSAAAPVEAAVEADDGLSAGVLTGLIVVGAVLAGTAGVWMLRRRRA